MADRGRGPRLVVVGATGLVGETMLSVLAERGHAVGDVRALVAADAVGRPLWCGDREVRGEAAAEFTFTGGDLVLLAVDAATSRAVAARALAAGARAIDNSAAFRADPAVPLVVPEVNGELLDRQPAPRLVANPNCSAIMLLVALEPLRAAFGLRCVNVATYQAVSGAGRAGVRELERSARAALDGTVAEATVFPVPCAFNVWPHESPVDAVSAMNEEEQKIVAEARRIWALPALPIDPACARVPVFRAHSQAITVELERPCDPAAAVACLSAAPSVCVVAGDRGPTAQQASGRDPVLVGRVRWAASELDRPPAERRRLSLWTCCDQLRKGAATNAVQIAERAGWLPPPR